MRKKLLLVIGALLVALGTTASAAPGKWLVLHGYTLYCVGDNSKHIVVHHDPIVGTCY